MYIFVIQEVREKEHDLFVRLIRARWGRVSIFKKKSRAHISRTACNTVH